MKKSQWLLTTTLAAAIAFTSLSVIASAEDGELPTDVERPIMQHMEEMQAAIESGDYEAFAEIAPEQLLEYINADNFGQFQEMHTHLQAAKDIAEELGLPKGQFMQKVHQHGVRQGQLMENREEIREAVENGDYQTWYELQTADGNEPKILEYVNEDNFHLLAELHEAIQNQDFETAQAIKEELGMPERAAVGVGEGQGNGLKGQSNNNTNS